MTFFVHYGFELRQTNELSRNRVRVKESWEAKILWKSRCCGQLGWKLMNVTDQLFLSLMYPNLAPSNFHRGPLFSCYACTSSSKAVWASVGGPYWMLFNHIIEWFPDFELDILWAPVSLWQTIISMSEYCESSWTRWMMFPSRDWSFWHFGMKDGHMVAVESNILDFMVYELIQTQGGAKF